MSMYLSEEEVEETIMWNPEIVFSKLNVEEDINIIGRQFMLPSRNRIDLLYADDRKNYWIIELKVDYVDSISVIKDQILNYEKELAKIKNISPYSIKSVLVSTKGFSKNILNEAKIHNIKLIKLEENELSEFDYKNKLKRYHLMLNQKSIITLNLFHQRYNITNPIADIISGNEETINCLKSISIFLNTMDHDEKSNKDIAEIFKTISEENSIFAHEIHKDKQTYVKNDDEAWFWLFYSVQDRRSNAARFVKAKQFLEDKEIYQPKDILEYYESNGKDKTIQKIFNILSPHGLSNPDSTRGELAKPTSILEAAVLVADYDLSINKIYTQVVNETNDDLNKAYNQIWDIITSIYGVGPRIAAQFIRGMVLKGNWNLPLDDKKQLEICKYNIRFASKEKIGLIENESEYTDKLLEFSSKYLDGNNGIISHALWVIRKKFCYKKMECDLCPLSGYCIRSLRKLVNSRKNMIDLDQKKLDEYTL